MILIMILNMSILSQTFIVAQENQSDTVIVAQENQSDDVHFELTLGQLEEIQIYVASRSLTTIEKAPSVVTVITAEDIIRQGHKSLRDVLDRVPGFYNQWDQNFSQVAIRGYAQDPTNNVLMLIDGHIINSQAGEGIGNTHILPFLYQVKQIEIIRGPGSTLWGADAAFGIINIITYDGADLAKIGKHTFEFNLDYEFDMKRQIYNLVYGTQFKNGDLMVTGTYTQSEGNNLEFYNIYTDDDQVLNTSQLVRHDQHRPSYNVQTKGHWGDFFLNAQLYEHKGYYRNVGGTIENEYREYKFNFIELGYSPKLTETLDWETNIYHNDIDEAWTRKETDGSTSWAWTQGYTEEGLTSILSFHPDNHLLKTGVQLTHRDFDGRKLISGASNTVVPASISGIETNYGVFSDYTYSGFEKWQIVLGARYQHRDLRQKGNYFLPRTAVIFQAADRWTMKYAYNTGIVGTTLNRSQSTRDNYVIQDNGVIILGPEEPQKSSSHDFQIFYNSDKLHCNLVFFYQKFGDFITKAGNFDTGFQIDGHDVWRREINLDVDLISKGIEFEWLWNFMERWSIYGNYSYSLSKFDESVVTLSDGSSFDLLIDGGVIGPDNQLTGVPKQIWNLGINYLPTDNISINFHYRGWDGAWGRQWTEPGAGFPLVWRYGNEHFFETAVNFVKDFKKSKYIRIQVYARNFLNNEAIIPMTSHRGVTQGNGSELGISLTVHI